ncbi:hypothetical protein AVEN_121249-1 [Araneus ventricosus]|uniref:Mos1 transposase HTH domain-containing protein n=2 Tax=Araneus ventricosus TaxID=182803 RepID=A0A4Y2L0C9_ARAVE|nr:hypothetical protein AVEN_121249-1 [Araneus ventricosus]
MRAQFEVLIFRVTSVRYCLISQNGQVVENWRSASRTEIRTTDLAAMEITVYHQDDNHEVQRPTDWPVQIIRMECKVDKTEHFRHHLLFSFNRTVTTAEATLEICALYGGKAMAQSIAHHWFSRLKKKGEK